jgi:hypothetical protein
MVTRLAASGPTTPSKTNSTEGRSLVAQVPLASTHESGGQALRRKLTYHGYIVLKAQ